MIRPAQQKELVCMRVGDVTVIAPGSVRRRCGDCGKGVWVSPASARAAGPDAAILCQPCFGAKARRHAGPIRMAMPTADQVREVLDGLAGNVERPPPKDLP